MPCITYETAAEIREREELARERQPFTSRERQLAPLREEISTLRMELKEREAMLCGVFSAILSMDTAYNVELIHDGGVRKVWAAVEGHYDGSEAGVTWADTMKWWEDHKIRDRQRRQAEAQQREIKREQILSKLTQQEREILGV